MLPHAFHPNHGMRLPLIVEGKGEWASELSSFAEVREGRSRWGRCNNGREIGFHMKIRIASERAYLYRVCRLGSPHPATGIFVTVVCEKVAEHLHGRTVCIAAENAEAAQHSAGRRPVPSKDAVASEEEVQAESGGQEGRT
jgi:hypothetical protein